MTESERIEEKINPRLLNEIVMDESYKKIRACIQCGECSAACPSGYWSPIRTRRIIRKALTGVASVLSDKEIWYCTTCFNCYERCPRNIPVTNLIIKLRNMAVREGYMPDPLKLIIRNLIEFGHAVPLGGAESKWAELREKHNLDRVPPTVHRYQEAMNEVTKILATIRFNRRIPYR